MMPDGKFVLVWTSDSSLQCDLTARRYDASATPIGPDFLVSTQTVGQEECRFQKVVADSTGGFVVAWQHAAALPSVERDGDRGGIFAQRYDAAGNPDPANLRVNRVRAWEQTGPDVAVDANGNAVVTWSGTALARFCRDDDPSCDRCPGFDDSIDADVDGIPDGCDLCTNVTGDQTMDDDVKVGVLHSDREVFDENDHYQGIVRASGRFRLPGPFATIDPSADGVFVRFAAPDGPMVMSADLSSGTFAGAGTAGWTLGLDGRKWTYRDKTGLGSIFPEYGELKATVEDRSTLTEPNLVRVTVKGKHGIYPTVAEDRTIDVTLVFGGQTASDAGQCAETSFAESDCRFIAGAQDNRIRCKR
jgi:hypothetical protein